MRRLYDDLGRPPVTVRDVLAIAFYVVVGVFVAFAMTLVDIRL